MCTEQMSPLPNGALHDTTYPTVPRDRGIPPLSTTCRQAITSNEFDDRKMHHAPHAQTCVSTGDLPLRGGSMLRQHTIAALRFLTKPDSAFTIS